MKIILDELKQISSLVNLAQLINESPTNKFPIFVTSFFGSARNLFVKLLAERERQIYLLCEDSKSLDECNAELSVLGLSDRTIIINQLQPDALQERLTEISGRDSFVLLSTYDLLTNKLLNQEQIKKNTTQVNVGGDLS